MRKFRMKWWKVALLAAVFVFGLYVAAVTVSNPHRIDQDHLNIIEGSDFTDLRVGEFAGLSIGPNGHLLFISVIAIEPCDIHSTDSAPVQRVDFALWNTSEHDFRFSRDNFSFVSLGESEVGERRFIRPLFELRAMGPRGAIPFWDGARLYSIFVEGAPVGVVNFDHERISLTWRVDE